MSKKTDITDEEITLFRASTKDVRPLKHNKILPPQKRKPSIPKYRANNPAVHTLATDYTFLAKPAMVDSDAVLNFSRPGLQSQIIRKLRRGAIAIMAEIDLHGLTIIRAEQALASFLAQAKQKRLRCIRIIHGKGQRSQPSHPVLKNQVNYWLQNDPHVLAFCSARPNDGGTGAVYVLLKQIIEK